MDNSGVPTFSDNTAGHDLAVDRSFFTVDGHAATGVQHRTRVGAVSEATTDDGGLEVDAALSVIKGAFGRIKGAVGDGHGSSTFISNIDLFTVAPPVVSHATAYNRGTEGTPTNVDLGPLCGGRDVLGVLSSRALGVVAAHDQFVVVSFLRTKRTAGDGQGRLAGLQIGTGSAGDLAAAHHEFGGRGIAADGGGDIAVLYGKETVSVSRQAFGVAAADDLADGTASDGEGDVALSLSGSLRGGYQPAAHEVVGALFGVVLVTASQRHVIRGPGHSHTGAAHDQHTGHGQAAESVHQVALFEHRLVPVDQIADGSLGQLHATILHPWFYYSHVRMGRWRKSRLFRHTVRTDSQ